jgi:hypothetical protein
LHHPGAAVLQPPPAAAAGRAPPNGMLAGNSSSSSQGAVYQYQYQYQDHVYLWAVDGLAGVVLSGIAANAIMSSKICEPRAYLWGKDSTTLSWHHPQMLLQQAAASHGVLMAPHHQQQQQRLGVQLGSSGIAGGLSIGLGQLNVGFKHSLGAWVVESPAGPLLSLLQQYHAPLACSSSSSWPWQQQQQRHHSSSSAAAGDATSTMGLGWPLLGGGGASTGGGGGSSSSSSGGGGGAAVSEVRSYQVTPLTGVNEAGQPSSAIAVAATTSRANASSCEEWVQVRRRRGWGKLWWWGGGGSWGWGGGRPGWGGVEFCWLAALPCLSTCTFACPAQEWMDVDSRKHNLHITRALPLCWLGPKCYHVHSSASFVITP